MTTAYRIGNLVLFDDRIGYIKSIDPKISYIHFPITNVFSSANMNKECGFYLNMDELTPVELSHEIITSFGFIKNSDPDLEPNMYFKKFWEDTFLYIVLESTHSTNHTFLRMKNNPIIVIMPVSDAHNLQNLYYSVAGIELKFDNNNYLELITARNKRQR